MSTYLPKIGRKSWALDPFDPKNDAISTISLCPILPVIRTIACNIIWLPLSLREIIQA